MKRHSVIISGLVLFIVLVAGCTGTTVPNKEIAASDVTTCSDLEKFSQMTRTTFEDTAMTVCRSVCEKAATDYVSYECRENKMICKCFEKK